MSRGRLFDFDSVVNSLGGRDNYLSMVNNEHLLAASTLVRTSITIDLQDATPAVFQNNPTLKKLLIEAVDLHSFDLVIQYLTKTLASQKPARQQPKSASSFRALFLNDYVGCAVDGLFRHLEQCNKQFVGNVPGRYYSRHCSITQSSGTGKTRTIIELSKREVLVVYINVRPKDDKNSYPARDVVPADILTSNLPCSPDDYADRCVAFFTALFECLLSPQVGLLTREGDLSKVLEAWSKDMCDMESPARVTFFEELQANYRLILEEIKSQRRALVNNSSKRNLTYINAQGAENSTSKISINNPDTSSASGEGQKSGALVLSDSSASIQNHSGAVSPELIGGPSMTAAYTRLVAQLPQLFANRTNPHSPKMVIAIDEAHELGKVVETHFWRSHILCKVISAFTRAHSRVSNWVVFASTASKVADFPTPSYIRPSHRISQGGELLFPQYILLGWDQMAPKSEDMKLEPQDVARFSHIVGYGRPLWSSLMATLVPADTILETACKKLCGSQGFDPTRPMQALAVLGQRCCLEPNFGHHGAISYQQQSVAGYMRVCTDTTENGIWQETEYPSEPLLSCAASLLLHAKPDNMASSLRCLMKEISRGLIDTVKQGEVVSRLLLLLAKDLCVRQAGLDSHTEQAAGDGWNAELLDCRPLPVVKYLEFLFGTRLDELTKKQFHRWYIDFSHWTPMIESIQASPEHLSLEDCLTQQWYRTTALQCCHSQPFIDKVIPMYYLAPPSKTKSNANSTSPPSKQPKQQAGRRAKPVSYILISDKAREKNARTSLNFITPQNSLQAVTGQPYIAILLDLRISGKDPKLTFVPKSSTDSASLRIYAPGLNTKTYPFLEAIPDTMSLLAGMLHPPVNLKHSCVEHILLRDQFKYGATCRPRHMRREEDVSS